ETGQRCRGRTGTAADRMTMHDSTGRSPAAGGGAFDSLAQFAPFTGLDPASLDDLTRAARPRTWPAGALVFSRGDDGDHLLAVCRGRIRLSLSSARGREIVLRTLEPGDILGEMALLDREPRSADATAVEPTTCLVLPRAGFEAVATRRPDVGMALARHLCALLRRTNFQMESIALYDLQTRLVRFLLSLIDQMPEAGTSGERRLALRLSQGDVAAILGATRPKVNLAFQTLLATGAVRRDGDALICDLAALSRLAEGDTP
ncbi:MAG TPA: Crp/Fnr family transcriptional regulator, partial [Paracoccaceae bacterium]|nr:Crp/Fnr family transcriptional regulator [Paracoccaceae bacterium]